MSIMMTDYKPIGIMMTDYKPIALADPYFKSVPAASQSVHGLPVDVLGILQASKKLTVRQHVKILPKTCCSCPPCVAQENTYSIFAGLTMDSEAEFLRIDEISEDWSRCCCKPHHPFKLEVKAILPDPTNQNLHSEYQQIMADMSRGWGSFTREDKAIALKKAYDQTPVLFTFLRDYGQNCSLCPRKWLSWCACMNCCQDGMFIVAGPVIDDPNKKGFPLHIPNDRVLGHIQQPNMCCLCHPYLELLNKKEGGDVFAKVDGPCLFGGWSECCCDFRFAVSKPNSSKGTGDVAVITKKKPQGFTGAMRELGTNADNFVISFNDDNMTAQEKVTILAANIILDYELFDGTTEKCEAKDEDDLIMPSL